MIADGLGLDRAAAALFCYAKSGETVSVMMARGAALKRPWPCIACRILSWIVEPDHCRRALGPEPTPAPAALRAGLALLVVLLAPLAVAGSLLWWLVT